MSFDPFKTLTSRTLVLTQENIDTDQIIPARFLTTTVKEGLGKSAFFDWRYDENGRPKNSSVFNGVNPATHQILVAGSNFGCGSSREHAPWALLDYGIRVIIAPSFADIFFNNSFKNGVLPITLDAAIVDVLFKEVEAEEGYQLTVDLDAQTITTPSGEAIPFEVDAFRRHCLLNGLDDIGLTLQHVDDIRAYEQGRKVEAPWLF